MEMDGSICLSPYKELNFGDKSIHDFVQEGYTAPDKVIAYLMKIRKPCLMSPGVYEHPFKPGTKLLGPYLCTDGKHIWDRDLWKYVVKYHVTLPQEFIDYVMSGEGDAVLNEYLDQPDTWADVFQKMRERDNGHCIRPDDAGDKDIDDF